MFVNVELKVGYMSTFIVRFVFYDECAAMKAKKGGTGSRSFKEKKMNRGCEI